LLCSLSIATQRQAILTRHFLFEDDFAASSRYSIFFHFFHFFAMNIFVAKLNYDTLEDDLRAAFEQYGEVSSCSIAHDKMTGRSKGFGFVEMDNDEEAEKAIDALNETDLDGRTIVVKKAEPRESRDSRGGGGGGGRGGYGGGGNRGGGGGYGGGGGNRGGGGYGGGGGGNRGGGGGDRW
jgi:cold-inducible RNA-binding protein